MATLITSLNTAQIASLSTTSIAALETADWALFTSSQVAALTTAQVQALETRDLVVLSTSAVQGFTTSAITALNTTQIGALGTAQLQALSTRQIAALETGDIVALNTTQVTSFTTAQIAALTTAQVAVLETADIVALRSTQIVALSTAHIAALTTAQVVALETSDIAAMSMTQVAAFESADLAVMSGTQLNALISVSPIVLDLNGDGIRTLAAEQGVQFDLAGTGMSHQVGWVSAQDGLLVRDINQDGQINDGRELFGTATQLASGQRAGDGYNALRDLDSDHDGRLTAADAHFAELKVWVDGNSDGVAQAGELLGLADLGIVSMDLGAQRGTEVDNGNLVALTSTYETADGSVHEMADVWFRKGGAAEGDAASGAVSGDGGDGGVAGQVGLEDLLVEAPECPVFIGGDGAGEAEGTVATVPEAALLTIMPVIDETPHTQPLL